MIPILETERLRLREWRLSDYEPFAMFNAVEATAKYVGGVMNRTQSWHDLAQLIGQWTLRGYGIWALEEKASGALVGYTGPWHPVDWPEPELAWGLMAGAQGKGFAFEGATRAREHIASAWGFNPTVSFIHPDNAPSRRLAERLGARVTGDCQIYRSPDLVYRHPKVGA